MSRPILKIKINVLKISKPSMFVGQKGTYLDVALFENAQGRDEFGNDGFAVQEVSKEQRLAGTKGEILGNWKYLDEPKKTEPSARPTPAPSPKPAPDPDLDAETDDIPF